MTSIILAIVPVFLLIFLGFGLRARAVLAEGFWQPAERLTYFILFPALLVTTLGGADLAGLDVGGMAGAVGAAILVMAFAALGAGAALKLEGPALTSLFQGAVRQNTYIGLAVSFGVFGADGLAAAALAVAVIVPLVNVLSVAMLARFGHGARPTLIGTARRMAENPLIIACVIGIGLNLAGLGLPPVVAPLLEILANGALPLGLLTVGAGLDIKAARAGGKTVGAAVCLKLVALPVITALACWTFGVSGIAAFVAVLFNGTPSAPTSYILARQLGGDARLMASIITVQTGLALITLPVALTFLV